MFMYILINWCYLISTAQLVTMMIIVHKRQPPHCLRARNEEWSDSNCNIFNYMCRVRSWRWAEHLLDVWEDKKAQSLLNVVFLIQNQKLYKRTFKTSQSSNGKLIYSLLLISDDLTRKQLSISSNLPHLFPTKLLRIQVKLPRIHRQPNRLQEIFPMPVIIRRASFT